MRIILITALACACAFGQAQIDGLTARGAVNMSGATSTRPVKTATSDPGTCTTGELLFRTDATAGQNIKGCTSANTWTLQSGSPPGADTTLAYNNAGVWAATTMTWTALTSTLNVTQVSTGDGTTAGEVKVKELAASGSDYWSWLAPDAITSGCRLKFPTVAPTAGQMLTWSAPSSGICTGSWATPSTGGKGAWSWAGQSLATASVTSYYAPGIDALNTDVLLRQWPAPYALTVTDLAMTFASSPAQEAGNPLTCSLYKNGTIEATVQVVRANADGTARGVKTDTGSVAFALGDLVSLGCANASASAATYVEGWSIGFQSN